ncbi:MAG: GntR family transcriptional regulator [Pseudomonadota bacterium]
MPDLSRPTRVNRAYDLLRADILSNRLPPGFSAPEPDLAERLGMSRTPLREALIRLEHDGLVELVPRRGVRVLPMYPDDMREVYAILAALEPEAAAELALHNGDPGWLKPLEDAVGDMEAALEADDLDAWAQADDRFHRELVEMSSNRRLTEIVTGLYDQVHRARTLTLRLREKPVQSTREHREVLNGILDGKPRRVRKLFRAHRDRTAAELLAILETYHLLHL